MAGSFPSLSQTVWRGSSQDFHMKSRAGYIEDGENRRDGDRNPVEEAQVHMAGSKIYIEKPLGELDRAPSIWPDDPAI
jgi:hypothetical protein